MKKFKLMALSCLAVFGLAACEAPEFLTKIIPSLKKEATVTSVAVSGAPASVTDETAPFQLVADVVVENDASKEVTWSTSNASVATVSESGLVTPVGAGSVTITATSVADTSKSGSVTFSVSVKPAVVSVTIKGASSEANAGSTMSLSAEVVVKGSVSKAVTWKSSDASVATVSSSGVVKFLKEGVVTITATSSLDSTKSDSVTITVKEGKWSDADKAMMQEYLGIVVPYFSGSFVWTDEYFEDYACLTAESNVSADYNSAVAGFEAAGWYIVDYEDEVYAILETADFQYLADIYEYGGIVSVDVYAYEIIKEWPTEDIAAALEEAGIEFSLPVFETEEAMQFTFDVETDEETGEILYLDICAYPDDEMSELTHLDYLEFFDDSFSKDEDTYGDYLVIPEDKSCMIYVMSLVDDEYEVVPGFEVVVAPYVADYSIKASVESEFIIAGQTATVSVEKLGADVPDDAVFSFSSSDEEVATVSAEGVVTAVKEGKVVISASYEGYVSSVTLYVKDSIVTAFTEAQLDMFKLLHDVDGVVVPFNPHFTDVAFDLEENVVQVRGDVVGVESVINYREALLADGWVDLYEEEGMYEFYIELMAAFGMEVTFEEVFEMFVFEGIAFEKEVKVSDSESYFLSADVYLYAEDEDATEGVFSVDLYDIYFYSYEDAKAEVEAIIAELEIESTSSLPETAVPASHYYVRYDEETNGAILVAYDSQSSLEDVKAALEGCGFVFGEITSGEGYSSVTGMSEDEVLDVTIYVAGSDVQICLSAHVEESTGVTIDFAEVSATAGTIGAYSFDTSKAGGQSDPAYNENHKELRLYASNTITFSSEETITSIFFDANTCGESKATGSFVSASVGTVSAVEGGFLWEGEATEVTLTVSASGQIHINSIVINGGDTPIGETDEEAFIQELVCLIFDQETAELDVDYFDEDGFYTAFQAESLTESIDQLYALLSQYYDCEKYNEDGYYGFYVDSLDGSCYADVYSYEHPSYGIMIEIDVYSYTF